MGGRGSGSGGGGGGGSSAKINTDGLFGTPKQNAWAAEIINTPVKDADWNIDEWNRILKHSRVDKNEANAVIKGLKEYKENYIKNANEGIKNGKLTSKVIIENRSRFHLPSSLVDNIRQKARRK